MTKSEKEKIKVMIEDGTIYEHPRYVKWRNKIFKRDGYACQYPACKWPMGTINAHHIHMKWYKPEWIFKEENGITLCSYHHSHVHKYGSNKYIEILEEIAAENIKKPKVAKKARNLKKTTKKKITKQLKNNKKRGKKRVVKLVKIKHSLVRNLTS